jgi:hypothetical protein
VVFSLELKGWGVERIAEGGLGTRDFLDFRTKCEILYVGAGLGIVED